MRTIGQKALGTVLLVLLAIAPAFAQGTVAPVAQQQFFDNNGNPLAFGKLYVYQAGTTTPTPIYANSALTVALANPMTLDFAGRLTYFLGPASYRFTLKTSADVLVWDVDNVSSVSPFNVNLDITGTACEALTAGDVVYLSDGSGSKTAGCWYKASASNTYSSTDATVLGMVPTSIASGASGSIRLSGQMTTASGVTTGTDYYIATTSGGITATAPTNARKLGRTDSTSSIVVAEIPATPNADNGIDDFRLTLTAGVPVTTSDVTAATTIYASPYRGNRIALFDSAGNATIRTSAEFSIAVPATTSQMYDVFCYSNAGVPTLELLATSRTDTTGLTLATTGVYTKTGDLTRRYLGSFRTTTVSGQTEDSKVKRHLWNYYNRAFRMLERYETAGSWTYSGVIRQANGSTSNQVDVVVGVAGVALHLGLVAAVQVSSATYFALGIGEDSTTTFNTVASVGNGPTAATGFIPISTELNKTPAVGRHVYSWNEISQATTIWIANNIGVANGITTGLSGYIEG